MFGKVAKILGGKVKSMATGSAPIDKAVLDFLKVCFCCPILEGYGLSETAAGGTRTSKEDLECTGHVGGPSGIVKLRMKDLPEMNYLTSDKPYPRGEICFYGPTIFEGYYKRPDLTAEAFDDEGWFLSGDVGVLYPNGAIRIIDRSKNIFKLSQGEYIAPEKLENIYVQSRFILQIMVCGDSLKNCTVAIIVPDEEQVKLWAELNGKMENALSDPDLKKEVMEDMNQLAIHNKLSGLEKPKEISFATEPFSIENGILTPTMKLKRNIGKKVYQEQIDKMYSDLEN